MGFRKEVREFIARERRKDDVIEILRKEIREKDKTIADLMDRLMAVNYERYATYRTEAEPEVHLSYEADFDETMAGEMIDGTTDASTEG